MNIIFVTMGAIYAPYVDVYRKLRTHIDQVGFYTSDKFYFEKNQRPDAEIEYLKEWDLTSKLEETQIDYNLINGFEKNYFPDESVWTVMNNDRRIFLGKYAKSTQDYRPNYSYLEMLKLFQIFASNIELFIERIQPSLIVGMGQGTIGDYLFYKIALAKNIKYVALKSVKNSNYQTLTETIGEEHTAIRKSFEEYIDGKLIEPGLRLQVKEYMEAIRRGAVPYEGNVGIPKKQQIIKKGDLANYLRYILKDIIYLLKKRDHHSQALYSLSYFYDNTFKAYRANRLSKVTQNRTIDGLDAIEGENYIFFPLHAEPEISLTNYSKFYQNQIEVIRNICLQLPSKYKLLVKEHPRNIGRRSLGYYKKILEIPNVDFANPQLPSIEVLNRSKLVIVLSGNIGYEAVLSQVPVITLGNTIYNMLPSTMVNHLDSIKNIYFEIDSTIENYDWNREILEKYIGAIFKHSFPLDVYTVLLAKEGREGGSEFSESKYDENIEMLSGHIYNLILSVLE